MKRTIDINNRKELNVWIRRSIELFENTSYLDNVLTVYPLQISEPSGLDPKLRRKIIMAHNKRKTKILIELLQDATKFPYEDPIWYLLKNIKGCLENNPRQVKRIANILYSMTAEETVFRLESPPKLNTQIGKMFSDWLKGNFNLLGTKEFLKSTKGIYVLGASEEEAKVFIKDILGQTLPKRPDLVAKVNKQYIIGEAKWISAPGGNQGKQVQEVSDFCGAQRGKIRRVGIIDGFPWAVFKKNDRTINDKEAVLIQESEYDIISAYC